MSRYIFVHSSSDGPEARGAISLVTSRVRQYLPYLIPTAATSNSALFTSSNTPVITLHSQRGFVLGDLFRVSETQNDAPALDALDDDDTRLIHVSRGSSLVSHFWGSYVAILKTADMPSHEILRGPLSRLKCFLTAFENVAIAVSNVDDLQALKLRRVGFNWKSLRAQAACADYLGRETALDGIEYLEAGERVEISGAQRSFSVLWNPCKIARENSYFDFDIAAAAMRRATESCTRSLALHHRRVLHRLSGGLDSSISAAACRAVLTRDSLPCVHYYSTTLLDDERDYAQSVASKSDLMLIEIARDPTVDLNIFRSCARTAWPALDFSGYGQYQGDVELCSRLKAEAIFTGELGDNIFENEAGRESATDFYFRHGPTPRLIRCAIEAAYRTDSSIWKTLRRAFSDGASRKAIKSRTSISFAEKELHLDLTDVSLLRRDAMQAVRDCAHSFIHPWMSDCEGTSPAKYLMLYGIVSVNAYEAPFASRNDPPIVSPLASQPLVEECLRIPTYLNNRGAVDRAVARHAFRDVLPCRVVSRTTKGTPYPWTRQVLWRNQKFFKELLLDGHLVKEGILDPKRTELAISADASTSRVFSSDLIAQIYIEAWLQRWLSENVNVAA